MSQVHLEELRAVEYGLVEGMGIQRVEEMQMITIMRY